ncbi:MAG: S8 family serine peptidase [Rhodospirillaceae bacterium]|nr:S8 family serine peptidase [Rhodospirillaceae bacterium]
MAKERIERPDARQPEAVDDGFDWLGSPNAVDVLVAQAVDAGRDWTFGWIRLADDARPAELAKILEGAGVEVVGSAGRLIRARLPGDAVRLASVAGLPGVDGLGALPSAVKLRAFDGSSNEPPLGEPVPVFVTLMADDVDGRWRRRLVALGAVVGRYDATIRVYTANVNGNVLDALAAADFVLAVEPVGVVEPAHDTAVPAMGADVLRAHGGSPGIFHGSGGASVPIGVMDTGLNINHPDIGEHRASVCGTNLVWFDPSVNDADLWVDARHHGTHVTGTIAGNGFLAPRFAGMAPSVRDIRFAKVLRRDTGTGFTDSVNCGMDFLAGESGCGDSDAVRPLIVNMSLSASSVFFVGRDVNARKLDATVWQHRQLYVVAQSNEAAEGFSNYAAAKNSLSVGALFDDGHVATFSSHGPTYDGRLAPQVAGTGVGVCSTEGNGKGAGYVCLQGTSMVAPSVAGVAALLLDANPDYRSQPALARARLMASAIRPDPWLASEAAFPSTKHQRARKPATAVRHGQGVSADSRA